MLAVNTELKNAQKVKDFLIKKNLLNTNFLPIREWDQIYFPILKRVKVPKGKVKQTKLIFPPKVKIKSIQEILKNKLTKKELNLIPKSQEVVGDILILEIPEKLQKKEKDIAEAYLKYHHNIKTVVKKDNIHSGVYRTRKVKVLAGNDTKETIHHENGIKLKLNVEEMYFSARSGNERLRIAKKVKKNENILVMFSGAAPYPLVLAKHSLAKKIYGVELNPAAHQFALQNIEMNKFSKKIMLFSGDVYHVLPKIRIKFDRVIMPLPKTGEDFLGLALKKSKKNSMIHLYSFLNEKEINKEAKRIKEICKEFKFLVKVEKKVKCGHFSPGRFRVCFDLKVL